MPRMEEVAVEYMSKSLTTLPMTNDVLLGTRFDAPWLGTYEQWLDWHRGNRDFLQALNVHVSWFTYSKDRPAIQTQIVENVRQSVVHNGARLLQQDFRTGDWKILTDSNQEESVRGELVFASSPLLQSMQQVLKRMIAFHRFTSFNRESMLARKSVVYSRYFERD